MQQDRGADNPNNVHGPDIQGEPFAAGGDLGPVGPNARRRAGRRQVGEIGEPAERLGVVGRRGLLIGAGTVAVGYFGIGYFAGWPPFRGGEAPATPVRPAEAVKPAASPSPEAKPVAPAAPKAAEKPKTEERKPETPRQVVDDVTKLVNKLLVPALRPRFVAGTSGEAKAAMDSALASKTKTSISEQRRQYEVDLRSVLPNFEGTPLPELVGRADFEGKSTESTRLVLAGQLPARRISEKVSSVIVDEPRDGRNIPVVSNSDRDLPTVLAEAFDTSFLKPGFEVKKSMNRLTVTGHQKSDGSEVVIALSRDLRFRAVISKEGDRALGDVNVPDYPAQDRPVAPRPAASPSPRPSTGR